MRLIDANELTEMVWRERLDTRERIANLIARQPTIERSVKRGKWLPSDSYITTAYGSIHCQICSVCGADLMEDNDYDYNFCPVCGADMRGTEI